MRITGKIAGIFLWSVCGVMMWTLTGTAETDPPLPDGPNRALVEDTCTPCHSAALILQNRMPRKRWDETLTWMQEKQGLEKLSPEKRNKILDYLEHTRGLDGPKNQARPRANPMYEYDYPPNPL